jgi:acetyl esterase/lipase
VNSKGTAGRLLVGLVVAVLVGGCAAGVASSPPSPSVATTEPSATVATPTPRPTPSVVATANVAYESTSTLLIPGTLDIYAPTAVGPWPVAVMFHAPGWWDELREHARRVADLGFVVFVPIWGRGTDAALIDTPPTYDQVVATDAQASCAVAFARAHAAEFGGDPARMIVFGHSGGANVAAMVAFARPEPSAGCLGGKTLGAIDALVVWEGDWILSRADAGWDDVLTADPRLLDGLTPWRYVSNHKDLKVVMLSSEHPGVDLGRKGGDPWAADSWLAVRDKSGALRRQLEANGAFADGEFDVADLQQLFFTVLKAQGNPVSLDVMPDSSHEYIVGGGWVVFLAAFQRAAGRA